MGATAHINREAATALRLVNTTGAALVAGEFTVMRGRGLVALEAIASLAEGALQDANGCELQVNEFDTGEGTFAAADLAVYFDTTAKKFSHVASVGHYKIGFSKAAKDGAGVLDVIGIVPVQVVDGVAALASAIADETTAREDITSRSGIPFTKVVKLTSALATTPVDILTDAEVGAGNKAIITDVDASVGGTAVWAGTGTKVIIRDKAGSPVTQVEFAKAQLGSQAQLGKHSTGVTLSTYVRTGAGATTAKGLELVADGTFETTGSDLTVIVSGIIVAA